ncbi:DUF3987 domain-containing protein [Microcoleus sp. B5-D4]|uniref:DUF3987 domain-containing protein n=1 Tax=unclassified Microcoleus TaxID=2642155 RepID=UPI002FD49A3F
MYDNSTPIGGKVSSTAKYLIEWCEDSKVAEAIAKQNIESLSVKEFNERVRPKEPIKTGGWWSRGVQWRTGEPAGNWCGQGKPDKPHQPEGSKPRKYLTGSGMEPDAIFLAMPDKDYWAKVHADKSIARHWTEGVKKAGAGLSLGLAVIALTGVWNWGKDGKLAKFVQEWAQPGTTHYIDFDSDYAANPSCRAAIVKFATLLIENGCTVHITCWDTKFKGMDDLIVGKSEKAFLDAVAIAPTFAEWEKTTSNVVRPSQFQVPPISELGEELDELLDSDLKKSQLRLKISELAQKYRVNSAEVWKIYREKEEELEQVVDREDTATDVAQLLASKSATLDLTAILPSELAEGITRLARTLNIKPECYALVLLTQVSTLLKPGTRTMLYPQTNFRVCPNFFAAMIAESSQKKTPIIRAIITDPMEKLNEISRKAFDEAQANYEEDLNAWKANKDEDKGPKPQEPARKVYYITAATGESIPKQAARRPDQALLWVADELAGMLKSPNQYRGGKGSDEENLLEYWSGGGAAVLRADGLAVDAPHVGLSIFGNIQPKVLAQFLGDGSDDNGKFARFELIQQPLAATELFEDAPTVDLTPMLSGLYGHLDILPPQNFRLDAAARKLFIAYYNKCERDRVESLKQGMRAMLGKAPEKVGKIATILHAIHSAFKGGEISQNIPAEIVRAAIHFVKYTTDQALSVNLDICASSALAPNLAKIVSLAERNGGTTTGAKIAKSYNAKLRPDSQKIREWLDQLAELKYGEVTSNGRNISFTLSPRPHSSPLPSKPYTETVESVPITSITESPKSPLKATNGDEWGRNGDARVPILESLPDKALSTKGDYGDSKNQFSENSSSLMLSCTTEPAEFAEQIRKAITNSDHPLAVQIGKTLRPKLELRNQVRAALTSEEFDNFRVLAIAGVIKGTRVKYIGACEQYQGIELIVDLIDQFSEIACIKPDGSYTTWLDPKDLEAAD